MHLILQQTFFAVCTKENAKKRTKPEKCRIKFVDTGDEL